MPEKPYKKQLVFILVKTKNQPKRSFDLIFRAVIKVISSKRLKPIFVLISMNIFLLFFLPRKRKNFI